MPAYCSALCQNGNPCKNFCKKDSSSSCCAIHQEAEAEAEFSLPKKTGRKNIVIPDVEKSIKKIKKQKLKDPNLKKFLEKEIYHQKLIQLENLYDFNKNILLGLVESKEKKRPRSKSEVQDPNQVRLWKEIFESQIDLLSYMGLVSSKEHIVEEVQNHPKFSQRLSPVVEKAKRLLVNYDAVAPKIGGLPENDSIGFLNHVLELGYFQMNGEDDMGQIKQGVIIFDKQNQSLIEEIEDLLFDMFKIDLDWLSYE